MANQPLISWLWNCAPCQLVHRSALLPTQLNRTVLFMAPYQTTAINPIVQETEQYVLGWYHRGSDGACYYHRQASKNNLISTCPDMAPLKNLQWVWSTSPTDPKRNKRWEQQAQGVLSCLRCAHISQKYNIFSIGHEKQLIVCINLYHIYKNVHLSHLSFLHIKSRLHCAVAGFLMLTQHQRSQLQ